MGFVGAIIGGIIGGFLLGPIGFIIGFAIGGAIGSKNQKSSGGRYRSADRERRYRDAVRVGKRISSGNRVNGRPR